MGEVGATRHGGKPRPLGQVKTETLCFQSTANWMPAAFARPFVSLLPAGVVAPAAPAAVGGNRGGGAVGGGGASIYPVYPLGYPQYAAGAVSATSVPTAGSGCSEESVRSSIRSMRELRESLRHAALLNIVASANNNSNNDADDEPPPSTAQGLGLAPPGLAPPPLALPRKRSPSPLALQVTSSRGSPFPQTTDHGGRSAGSGTYHMPNRDSGSPSSPHHALVANLLSPRTRTISIPRPGPQVPQDLPGPFIHKSVSLAKDCLAKVGLTVKPRGEAVEEEKEEKGGVGEGVVEGKRKKAVPGVPATSGSNDVSSLKVNGVGSAAVPALILTARGQSLEKSPHHHLPQPNTAHTVTGRSGLGSSSAQSRSTSITVTSTTLPQSGSVTSESSRSTAGDSRGTSLGKAEPKGSEDRGGGTTLYIRRHLTPGKKRELVMRLSEMVKCEAVDLAPSLAQRVEAAAETPSSMPPMIIMSQQRLEQKRLDDSSTEQTSAAPPPSSSHNNVDIELCGVTKHSGAIPCARSLSSLIASNNYNYSSLALTKLPAHKEVISEASPEVTSLQPEPIGSGSDMAGQGDVQQDPSPPKPSPGTAPDSTGKSAGSLFTNGIVGKTIGRDGECGAKMAGVESRPLLPSATTARPRHGRRHSGRRSSLRDWAPADPCVPPLSLNGPISSLTSSSSTTTTTSTTILSMTSPASSSRPLLRSHSFTTAETATVPIMSEHNSTASPALPVLTITGLQPDKTTLGKSCAANGTAPSTARGNLSQRLQLVQELDDQCEKLQRQLNISLSVPKRPPLWQHSPMPPAPPISRSDVSLHLQCVSLGEGRPGDKGDTTGFSSSSCSSASSSSRPLLSQPLPLGPAQRFTEVGKALSDVEEQSVNGAGSGGGTTTDRTHPPGDTPGWDEEENLDANAGRDTGGGIHPQALQNAHERNGGNPAASPDRMGLLKGGLINSEDPEEEVPASSPSAHPADMAPPDPVMYSVKEPRYQGFSSKVPENEGRSQFHYVHPPAGAQEPYEPEEAREMKYRVLKALDQDVYYDFQHRKYRNSPASGAPATPATPVSRCNKEEDRPRVHFYKVKVNGDS